MTVKLVICFLLFLINMINGLKLEQVVILGRHNIRAPLTKNLKEFSSYSWPKWNVDAGHLTPKGMILEEYMGKHISEWLQNENLLPADCSTVEKMIFIYANTRQRTKESAKAFVKGAFRNCNISIFSIDSNQMDPTFHPIFRNPSKPLKDTIIQEMSKKINDLHLNDVYIDLEKILNIKDSPICRGKGICSFVNRKDEIHYKIGEEPNVIGPLKYSTDVIDSFLMTYYEGMPMDNVAWGKVTTIEQWKAISRIATENINVRFNSTILAKEVAKPLLEYIYNIISNNTHKFVLLAGHDSNVMSVMAALGFEPHDLPERFESIPIGSKLIFQKLKDENKNQTFLKVSFVYQTPQELRDGNTISEAHWPQWVNMKLKACPTECPWNTFETLLFNVVHQ